LCGVEILKYIDVNEIEMLKFCSYLDSIAEYEVSDAIQLKIAQPNNKFVKTASYQKIANASFEENVFRFANLYSQYVKDTNNHTPFIKVAIAGPEAIYEALKVLGFDEVRYYSADEIKKAYRLLSKKLHPDVSSDPKATEIFKNLANAKDTLANSSKSGDVLESTVQASYNAYKVKMSGGGSGPRTTTETPKSGPRSRTSPGGSTSSETPPRSGPTPKSPPKSAPSSSSAKKLTPEIMMKVFRRLKLPQWAINILNSKIMRVLGYLGLGYGLVMLIIRFADQGWAGLSSAKEKAEFTSILSGIGALFAPLIPPPAGEIIAAMLSAVSFGTGVASWFLKGDEDEAPKKAPQSKPSEQPAPQKPSKPSARPEQPSQQPSYTPAPAPKPRAPDRDKIWSDKVNKDINNIVFD
jgi:hypothetical protein